MTFTFADFHFIPLLINFYSLFLPFDLGDFFFLSLSGRFPVKLNYRIDLRL